MQVKSFIVGIICLVIPPCSLKNLLLKGMGWRIGRNCRIGLSWIYSNRIRISDGAHIGHANIILTEAIFLKENSYIGHLNRVTGPLWLILNAHAGIGNQNIIVRGKRGVSWGRSIFKLGQWSKFTVKHVVDCTRSVIVGDYSTFAGRGSQVWTHGYLHAANGLERTRIDGSIRVGNNVYIGSACVLNAGIVISDAISIGAASCVSKSLLKTGMYVSQPLRHIALEYTEAANRHPQVSINGLVERVINKKATT